jgi:glycosyltransferase involved in cell wall biosynthesis
MIHNRYMQSGGEDVAFEQESMLLKEHGHAVHTVEKNNADSARGGLAEVGLFVNALWARATFDRIRRTIREFRPDVVHVHNFLSRVSPSVFQAAWAEHVPVVHTLHNYRMICPAATLYRDGRVCEDCVGRSTWRGVVHACYRNSRKASLGVAAMLELHRALGTWERIDAYIAVSHFVREKVLLSKSMPASRVYVKPNFVVSSNPIRKGPGEYALYVGRLSPEKGVKTLMEAWTGPTNAAPIALPLKLVGAGPLGAELRQRTWAMGPLVEVLGQRSRTEVGKLMANARLLLLPSEWYEPLSVAAIEGMAAGVPLLASNTGGFRELVRNGRTGLLFEPGNVADLARSAAALAENLDRNIRMGLAARRNYLNHFTPERNYKQLIRIYQKAINHAHDARPYGSARLSR